MRWGAAAIVAVGGCGASGELAALPDEGTTHAPDAATTQIPDSDPASRTPVDDEPQARVGDVIASEGDGGVVTTGADDRPSPCDELFASVDDLVLPHSSPGFEYSTGTAWADVDGDGWIDAVVTDHGGPNQLLRNDGRGRLVIAPAGALSLAGLHNGGVTFADHDNDGWRDLYVSVQDAPNVLLRNLAGTGFVDVTAQAGVGDPGRGIGSAWADYDGDGDLDLYSLSWNDPKLVGSGVLYENQGDGTFVDRTDLLGLDQTSRPAFAAQFFDYDNDGDPDLYVVVDRNRGNVLWRNDGDGCDGWCWSDVSAEAGVDLEVSGMGVAVGDYDGDLDLDLYVTHGGRMYLMQSRVAQGVAEFVDVTFAAGVSMPTVGWGAAFFDYDNDGWLDLYLANGPLLGVERNGLFHNLGDGTFEDVSDGSGADDIGRSYSVAYADYDRDGSLDLMVGNRNQAYVLYRNCGLATGHHFLSVGLTGGGPVNRDAIGARVRITTSDGRVQMQEVASGSSIGSGHSPRLHFGLGRASVERLLVRWPDGTEHALAGHHVPVDGELELTYPR